ncbi:Hypothetical protein D9617_7g030290 [Elsinoe fawcettii]|nr:Hypothetical protein D9617_7g030290 [Elsinoe fawcettii]
MFNSRRTAAPTGTRTTHSKPSLMQRLRGNKAHTTRTTKHSHNPITGTHTTTTTEHANHHHTPAAAPRAGRTSRKHRTAGTTTTAPAHHHRRRPSLGDKMSGAMMKLRGSLTRRPGLKAAGTRRMHGTDGRGARY